MLCFVYLSDMLCVFFFKQKTAYEMRISDWSSDVCSSDLSDGAFGRLRQPALHLIEIFEHARARPVEIGAILEDDIDEAVTKEAVASNRPRAWHREHGGGERIGYLVLYDPRRPSRIVRPADYLRISVELRLVKACVSTCSFLCVPYL